MALFFDAAWFDAQLARLHMSREDVGAVLGLDGVAVSELWKDQRELKAADVSILAALFNRPPAEVAHRAGISTPVPASAAENSVLERLDAIEAKLDEILRRLSRA
ncbi:MAG: hypothetical protein IT548_04370 [Alphaproteobacteria bacterium]|nr:hypothetical protein [Alphaproteobacteria bacterium]